MTTRESFEAWLNPGRHAGNVSQWVKPGRYEKEIHQLAWLAWQAATAAALAAPAQPEHKPMTDKEIAGAIVRSPDPMAFGKLPAEGWRPMVRLVEAFHGIKETS